ncbi:DUF2520 domain-containing protein [Desulfobacterales bacterium HSG16]|nr:DUF2520 domain-containing protein [Desulfobacterales bacterium HSG16]
MKEQEFTADPVKKTSFSIIGCGKVGTSLARFLVRAGYVPAGFASQSIDSAKMLADTCNCPFFYQEPEKVCETADIVFLTTPDGFIEDTCQCIASSSGFKKGGIVLHCSGAHPSDILNSAKKRCSSFIGSMHPLQSFALKQMPDNPFSGIIVSVEGDSEAVRVAKKAGEDLGASVIEIRTNAKVLYHAAAVAASNYLVTLMDLSFKLIKEAGIDESKAYGILKPLIEGTLSNIEAKGPGKALTGPIARGDVETITRHLDEMEKKLPECLALYRSFAYHTIDIARPILPDEKIEQLETILK